MLKLLEQLPLTGKPPKVKSLRGHAPAARLREHRSPIHRCCSRRADHRARPGETASRYGARSQLVADSTTLLLTTQPRQASARRHDRGRSTTAASLAHGTAAGSSGPQTRALEVSARPIHPDAHAVWRRQRRRLTRRQRRPTLPRSNRAADCGHRRDPHRRCRRAVDSSKCASNHSTTSSSTCVHSAPSLLMNRHAHAVRRNLTHIAAIHCNCRMRRQPVMFTIIFTYIFGGSMVRGRRPFVDFVIGGLIAMNVYRGDRLRRQLRQRPLEQGEPLRTLPMRRSSVLIAHQGRPDVERRNDDHRAHRAAIGWRQTTASPACSPASPSPCCYTKTELDHDHRQLAEQRWRSAQATGMWSSSRWRFVSSAPPTGLPAADGGIRHLEPGPSSPEQCAAVRQPNPCNSRQLASTGGRRHPDKWR